MLSAVRILHGHGNVSVCVNKFSTLFHFKSRQVFLTHAIVYTRLVKKFPTLEP